MRFAHKPEIERNRKENRHLECRDFWTQKEVWEKSTPEYFILPGRYSPLRESALYKQNILQTTCHTEKHTLNKIPFLTSLLFPPLPFDRGKGSIYNIDHFY